MSLTGTGFEVNTRGGCFLGKNVSWKFWRSECHNPGSKPFGMSRLSSGSAGAELCGGFNSKVAIMLPESKVNRLVSGSLLWNQCWPQFLISLGDECPDQVAQLVTSCTNG